MIGIPMWMHKALQQNKPQMGYACPLLFKEVSLHGDDKEIKTNDTPKSKDKVLL